MAERGDPLVLLYPRKRRAAPREHGCVLLASTCRGGPTGRLLLVVVSCIVPLPFVASRRWSSVFSNRDRLSGCDGRDGLDPDTPQRSFRSVRITHGGVSTTAVHVAVPVSAAAKTVARRGREAREAAPFNAP